MQSAPGELDGVWGNVLVGGRVVAGFEFIDRRYAAGRRVHEQLYVRLTDYDAEWARQLPRPMGAESGAVESVRVDLECEDGREFEGVAICRPWSDGLGIAVDDLLFPVEHPDI
jgi:hypothetical protein